jgi:predicted dehydrogenase
MGREDINQSEKEELLEVAVIGCGRAGNRRIQAVLEYPGCHLALAVDSDSPVLTACRDSLPDDVLTADSLDQALAGRSVDIAIISTPPGLHEAQFAACLDAGVRHVLVEKPLAGDAEAARRMVARAGREGVHLKVGSNLRQFAEVRALLALASEGQLGTIRESRFNIGHDGSALAPWAEDVSQAGGGTLLDNGVHVIDLATQLGALPEEYAVQANVDWLCHGIDRHACWTLKGERAVCEFSSSWTRSDGVYLDASVVSDNGEATLVIGGPDSGLTVRLSSGYQPVLPPGGNSWTADTHHFLDHCFGGRSSGATGQEGAAALAVVDSVYCAAQQGV